MKCRNWQNYRFERLVNFGKKWANFQDFPPLIYLGLRKLSIAFIHLSSSALNGARLSLAPANIIGAMST
jgi:hypothetical protein